MTLLIIIKPANLHRYEHNPIHKLFKRPVFFIRIHFHDTFLVHLTRFFVISILRFTPGTTPDNKQILSVVRQSLLLSTNKP
jgi:hypothetical protein